MVIFLVMFARSFFFLFVSLSVRPPDCLKNSKRIRMKFLPEVCLGPRNNRLNIWDDANHYPDTGSGLRSGYDPDRTDLHQTFTRSVSRVKDQSRIRITICNFGKGLQSLTDSLCSCVIQCLPCGDLNYQTTCALQLHDSCYPTLVSVHSYQIG